jgi:hypothetical protein
MSDFQIKRLNNMTKNIPLWEEMTMKHNCVSLEKWRGQIIALIIAFNIFNSTLVLSYAGTDPAPDDPPLLTWMKLYNSYYKFYQLQYLGDGDTVALASGKDIHLLKFSAGGDVVWDRRLDAGNASSLTRTKDGGFLICGYISGIDISYSDICLLKTDAEGIFNGRSHFQVLITNMVGTLGSEKMEAIRFLGAFFIYIVQWLLMSWLPIRPERFRRRITLPESSHMKI